VSLQALRLIDKQRDTRKLLCKRTIVRLVRMFDFILVAPFEYLWKSSERFDIATR